MKRQPYYKNEIYIDLLNAVKMKYDYPSIISKHLKRERSVVSRELKIMRLDGLLKFTISKRYNKTIYKLTKIGMLCLKLSKRYKKLILELDELYKSGEKMIGKPTRKII